MSYNHAEQQRINLEAMLEPQPGDYWHEMFCPYFLVVQVKGAAITILNCLPHRGVSARKPVDDNHWMFDVSQSMVVDQAWIEKLVRYDSIDGFVADVSRGSERNQAVVNEWIQHRGQQLVQELQELGPEISRRLLMEHW